MHFRQWYAFGDNRSDSEGQPAKKKSRRGRRGDRRSNSAKKLGSKVVRDSTNLQAAHFRTLEDANLSSDGWQGRLPPKCTQDAIRKAYDNGSIKKDIGSRFLPVPYDEDR